MPAARPSRPSMKLMALAMPTTHSTVTKRRQVRREGEDAEERHPEEDGADARERQHAAGQHHAGELGRGRHALAADLAQLVDQPGGEDDDRADHDAERDRARREDVVELAQQRWRRPCRRAGPPASPRPRCSGSASCARPAGSAARGSRAGSSSLRTSGVEQQRRQEGDAEHERVGLGHRSEPRTPGRHGRSSARMHQHSRHG